jgi:hypothetical protein
MCCEMLNIHPNAFLCDADKHNPNPTLLSPTFSFHISVR